MKIAVCVKEVPDASAPKRLDPQTFRLDRSVAGALNEFDTHAIEEGLQLKTKSGEGEVVAVLMGPERAADSLRKALAIGADRAVHVSDEGLAGSDLVATSKALAKALERMGRRAEAVAEYRRLLADRPDYALAREALRALGAS